MVTDAVMIVTMTAATTGDNCDTDPQFVVICIAFNRRQWLLPDQTHTLPLLSPLVIYLFAFPPLLSEGFSQPCSGVHRAVLFQVAVFSNVFACA